MASLKSTLNPKYRHGLTDKTNPSEHHQIYNTWMNMKARCLRKTNPKYKRYGGRGITIYQPWLDIVNFYKWSLENGWMPNYSIDRIDNNGNYCPENCRWVSVSENSRKKSTTKLTIEQANEIRIRALNGENEYDLAKEYNIVHGTVWFILKNFTHVKDGDCTKQIKERKDKKGV